MGEESSGIDVWDQSVDAADLVPCARCGSLIQWQSVAGYWHCERCEPHRGADRCRQIVAKWRAKDGRQ